MTCTVCYNLLLESARTHSLSPESSRIAMTSLIYDVLNLSYSPNPFSRTAKRIYRFCVPEEWFRRPNHRKRSSASLKPSEATLRRLAAMEEFDEDEDEDGDEGTAKIRTVSQPSSHQGSSHTTQPERAVSPNRLSSLFDGWLRPMSPPPVIRHPQPPVLDSRKNVSEPQPVKPSERSFDILAQVEGGINEADFENMLV